MMSLTFGLFTQVSGSGPLGPLDCLFSIMVAYPFCRFVKQQLYNFVNE